MKIFRRLKRGRSSALIFTAIAVVLVGCATMIADERSGERGVTAGGEVVAWQGDLEGPATQGDWQEATAPRHVMCGLDDVEHADLTDTYSQDVPRRGWDNRQSDEPGRCGDDYETLLFRLANCERQARGLEPLQCDLRLVWAARAHSLDMDRRDYFSHVDPDGATPAARLQARGMRFQMSGENIALAPTMAHTHAGWMTSQGHRESILHPDFTHMGIGVVRSDIGYLMTALFTRDF